MGITAGARKFIEEKYRTSDQKILDPNIWLKDFPLDPGGLFLKTNNFVQQGLNRLLAYSPTAEKWIRVQADSEGRLLTTSEKTLAGAISIVDRDMVTTKVINNVSLAIGNVITHTGLEMAGYNHQSWLISSTGNVTIYLQGSNDNVNWYDHQDETDTARTFACSNEKIWIPVDNRARYVRAVVFATTASTVTVESVMVA